MSRFVSGGTDEEPTERDEAWLTAQQQIEATRQSKIEIGKQEGGKSLYDTLQANKGGSHTTSLDDSADLHKLTSAG